MPRQPGWIQIIPASAGLIHVLPEEFVEAVRHELMLLLTQPKQPMRWPTGASLSTATCAAPGRGTTRMSGFGSHLDKVSRNRQQPTWSVAFRDARPCASNAFSSRNASTQTTGPFVTSMRPRTVASNIHSGISVASSVELWCQPAAKNDLVPADPPETNPHRAAEPRMPAISDISRLGRTGAACTCPASCELQRFIGRRFCGAQAGARGYELRGPVGRSGSASSPVME